MGTSQSPLIVIPARIGSTRLKEKPLRLINGRPLIWHVCRRALEADIGLVVVSSDDMRVLDATADGVECVLADAIENEHCGSDRVADALEFYPGYDYIINLQGDLPFIDPQILRDLWADRRESAADIATAVCRRVPVTTSQSIDYFARTTLWEHVGLYAYTKESLELFASLPPSERELEYGLEQLRALEHGMSMSFTAVDHMPLEINTESDLYHANLIAGFCRLEDTGACSGGPESHPGPDDGGF